MEWTVAVSMVGLLELVVAFAAGLIALAVIVAVLAQDFHGPDQGHWK